MTLAIVPLADLPPDRLAGLVTESEQGGLRFLRRLVEEWDSGSNRFNRPHEALFAANLDGRVVGVCGLNCDPYTQEARIGRVRHLYVLAPHRRTGIGRRLVEEVIAAATGPFNVLRVRTESGEASRFYEALGFRACVELPATTHALDLHAIGKRK
jgi:GNAT superfamily N-acetyltransferase